MENRNRIDLTLIPVGGVDESISCDKCSSACCREGMVIPLSDAEAESLREAGTSLKEHQLPRKERRRMNVGKSTLYYLNSACGNLVMNDGEKPYCGVFGESSPTRPNACADFRMGGYNCGVVQLARVVRGQDTFVVPEA